MNRGIPIVPSGVEAPQALADAKQAEAIPDSFIDKSFQLRFHVPPPVLSNWKAYLENLAAQALPLHPAEDKYTIYNIFNLCRAEDSVAPTPRELKTYVNQIGAIHRQWGDEFPIGHVAYYVILRRRAPEDIPKRLLTGKSPESNIEDCITGKSRT